MAESNLLPDKNLAELLLFDKLEESRIEYDRNFFDCDLYKIRHVFAEINKFLKYIILKKK